MNDAENKMYYIVLMMFWIIKKIKLILIKNKNTFLSSTDGITICYLRRSGFIWMLSYGILYTDEWDQY